MFRTAFRAPARLLTNVVSLPGDGQIGGDRVQDRVCPFGLRLASLMCRSFSEGIRGAARGLSFTTRCYLLVGFGLVPAHSLDSSLRVE